MRAILQYENEAPYLVDLECYFYRTRQQFVADLKIMLRNVLGSYIAIRTPDAHIVGIIDRVDDPGTVWIRISSSSHTYEWVWCWIERIDKLTLPDPNRLTKSLCPDDHEALITAPLPRQADDTDD